MGKPHKIIISKFLVISSLLLILSASFWYFFAYQGQITKETALKDNSGLSESMESLRLELEKRWIGGNLEQNTLVCPLLPDTSLYDSEFLKCNFLYMECYLQDNFSFEMGNQNFEIMKGPQGKFLNIESASEVSLQVKHLRTKSLFNIHLFDSCRSNFLPPKIYSTGEAKKKDLIFDTFGQTIFIDKDYIHYKDVYQKEMSEGKMDWEQIDLNKVHLPVTNLLPQKMNEICHARGGKILKAHLFDAASFFPTNVNTERKFYFKSSYHWQKNKRGSFFDDAKHESRFQLKKENCEMAYVKGCEEILPLLPYQTTSVSWIGLRNPLGGHLEFLPNDFETNKNLKLSSLNFFVNSDFHEVGVRGTWGQEGFEREDFSFEGSFDSLPPYEVSFRCFYQEKEI